MCMAMNRSIWNDIRRFRTTGGSSAPAQAAGEQGTHQETDVDTLASELTDARDVVIVPGYGMAVARAQHAVHELTKQLKDKACACPIRHPPCGRPSTGAHECTACRGQCALRHRS